MTWYGDGCVSVGTDAFRRVRSGSVDWREELSVVAFGSGDDAVAFGGECGTAWVGQVLVQGVVVGELEDLDFVGSVVCRSEADSRDNCSGVFVNDP